MLPSQARSLLQARQDWDGAGRKQVTQAQRALPLQWGRDHREATRLHLPLLRHPVSPCVTLAADTAPTQTTDVQD